MGTMLETTAMRISTAILAAVLMLAMARASVPEVSATRLEDAVLVAFDVETTGLSSKRDRIVEIGAVKFQGGREIARRNWLVHPDGPIPAAVQQIHGITDEMVADAPTFAEVYPDFLAFVGDAALLAHNAAFDVRFIREEVRRAALPQPANPVIDTLRLFRAWYPELRSHRLATLARHVGIDRGRFHRGEADAAYLMAILLEGCARHPDVDSLDGLIAAAGGAITF